MLFLKGMPIASLKYAGRWRVESSLEAYVQEAMAHLKAISLSDDLHYALHHLILASEPQWHAPPSTPWPSLFSRAMQWRGLQGHRLRSMKLQLKSLPN
jgi:hypothetical protein